MAEEQDVKDEQEKLPVGEPSTSEQISGEEPIPPVATDDKGTETEESGKGANQRIRELNAAKKAAEEKAESLADKLAALTKPAGLPSQETFKPQVEAGQEITPEQYQTDVAKTAKAQVDLAIAQNNAVNRINNESIEAIRKYPQLDPNSDQFDKELSDTVTEAVESQVRVNPYNASVIKFVDKLMKPYQGAVAKEVGKASENIAKQVSESALRPNSVRQPEKNANEKSIAELEQELGVVIS